MTLAITTNNTSVKFNLRRKLLELKESSNIKASLMDTKWLRVNLELNCTNICLTLRTHKTLTIIWRVLFWVKNFCSKEKEISNLNMPNHWIERAKETKEESSFKVKLILVQITSSNLRRRFIEHTRLHSNFLNNWKMQKWRFLILKRELLICSQRLQFISLLDKILLTRNWLNISTTSLRDKSWRSFSWERAKVFINLEPRELPLR